ncbi:hypothetical protein HIM_10129 [Hirsutella minnesotensis 3608]|uniref:Non-hemolytic phospholipase C n=1 Tax=Hirsutella minnesotensis 3608 TaxID=1043627 RepID=A0A0F7ZKE9_9HYPO|nr:hypothetical protein HIM_10129 [Hirsutella minnesotensis 3608]
MAGVRGFGDANIQMNNGVPVWQQLAEPAAANKTKYITPWYLNYLGGKWPEATQCMIAGSNGWYENHAAWNHGTNDHWALNNTPWSIGFYKKQDIPTQWTLADEWVVADMYQESVVASTSPNRVVWTSGSINVPGGPQRPDQGGNPYIDNNETPGCDSRGINCYPLKWRTAAEYYEEAGVSWQVYQDADNFDDNPFAWFQQFQEAKQGSRLHEKGMKGLPLDTFYAQASNGSLPEISYIIAPTGLSEHAPFSPHDGAWLQKKIAEAVIKSPKYSKTVLIVSFDETGGWFDHVDPYRSPDGTPGEWLDDPYGQVGHTFAGPGFRVPMYIISPWTRRGGVYAEHADHNSQLLFIEKWQAAKGRNVTTDEMVAWRRRNMADLVGAFDFARPDLSVPQLPDAPAPHTDELGNLDGAAHCMALHPRPRPPVPYGVKDGQQDVGSFVESGFCGRLTEGRSLVLEMNGHALAVRSSRCSTGTVGVSPCTARHELPNQRWVAHAVRLGGDEFTLASAVDGRFLCGATRLCEGRDNAQVFVVGFVASMGYSFRIKGTNDFLAASCDGQLKLEKAAAFWTMYSVSYRP